MPGLGRSPPTCKRPRAISPTLDCRRPHRSCGVPVTVSQLKARLRVTSMSRRTARSRPSVWAEAGGGPDRPAARPSTPGMREVRWAEVSVAPGHRPHDPTGQESPLAVRSDRSLCAATVRTARVEIRYLPLATLESGPSRREKVSRGRRWSAHGPEIPRRHILGL